LITHFGTVTLVIKASTHISATTLARMDEGRKRVLLIAAAILAARKLAQYDSGARVPATVSAIADAIRWAERIMEEIDRRWPVQDHRNSGQKS
jgi:hypothetical protein